MAFKDDDFEFRPLSEGLGFHKKVIDLGDKPQAQKAAPLPLQQNVPSFNPSLRNKDIVEQARYSPQQGAQPVSKNPTASGGASLHSKLWAQPQAQAKMKTGAATVTAPVQKNKFAVHTVRDELLASATSWPAAIFDSTMVLGLVLVFSAAIFAITRIELAELIEMLRTEGAAQVSALILLVSVYGMYTVTCRTFFGKTLGDSVFYYQLGTREEQNSVVYPAKVFLRSLLIAFTGFITLPILSSILNKDVAGTLSGVSLYAEKK